MNLNDQDYQQEFYPSLSRRNQILFDKITQIIKSNRLVSDRELDLKSIGIEVDEFAMGSGGVGQVKTMKDHYRIQIGYGKGKWNYASVAIIPF